VTGSQGLVTIPEVNRMALEASVSEAEVHRVQVGQSAIVRVEAFADARLPGTVTRIGTLARALADRPIEDKRFDLIVELGPTDVDLRPEMTARADIVVGTRPDVLLVPVNAIFERQGRFVAHVVGPQGTETREVDLGESNDVLVEVTTGLHEGEQVALTDRDTVTPDAAAAPAITGRERSINREVNALQPR
jgi:HlyD family secretion protein